MMAMMTMEEADRIRLARSSLVAIAFWLALAVCLAVIPLSVSKPPVPEYSTVRLTLNEPAAKPVPAASVAAVAPAITAAPAKAAPAVSRSAQAASKAAAKTAAKTAAQNASPPGLGIPNFSTPVTNSAEGNSSGETLDFQSENQLARTEPASSAKASSVSEFEGVAAPLASAQSAKSAGTKSAGVASAAASGETVTALGEISGAAKGGSAKNGTASSPASSPASGTASAASSVSKLGPLGTSRKLVKPANPVIVLPDELARLVTSNPTVVVSFRILADGTVPSGAVEFTPSASLPAQVRDWLAKEFSTWRFEKSAENGQARFSYSIKVE